MRVRLGYPDRIVEVDGKSVHVFKGRLVSAPLSEVINYYVRGEGLLPPAVREIAEDIVRVVIRTGELEGSLQSSVEYSHRVSA